MSVETVKFIRGDGAEFEVVKGSPAYDRMKRDGGFMSDEAAATPSAEAEEGGTPNEDDGSTPKNPRPDGTYGMPKPSEAEPAEAGTPNEEPAEAGTPNAETIEAEPAKAGKTKKK